MYCAKKKLKSFSSIPLSVFAMSLTSNHYFLGVAPRLHCCSVSWRFPVLSFDSTSFSLCSIIPKWKCLPTGILNNSNLFSCMLRKNKFNFRKAADQTNWVNKSTVYNQWGFISKCSKQICYNPHSNRQRHECRSEGQTSKVQAYANHNRNV